MKIEAFSEGKNLDAPEANEDQFLVLPGRAYGVLDGCTDISGRLYDGMRAGRLASRIAAKVVAEIVLDSTGLDLQPQTFIEPISTAFRDCYARHGLLEAARGDPARRFGSTLTLAVDLGEVFRFVLIGDSGLRINGTECFVNDTVLDIVTAGLRVTAHHFVADAGGDAEGRAELGRACAFYGAARIHAEMLPWVDEPRRRLLYERSLAWCRARLPAIPEADIRRVLDTGISGQTYFQNNEAGPLSYAALDGFAIPMSLVQVIDRPRATIHSIELYTDGYFKPGATPAVADWETSFAEVERMDPEKIGPYPSVKGSTDRMHTDDRTVVIVHP